MLYLSEAWICSTNALPSKIKSKFLRRWCSWCEISQQATSKLCPITDCFLKWLMRKTFNLTKSNCRHCWQSSLYTISVTTQLVKLYCWTDSVYVAKYSKCYAWLVLFQILKVYSFALVLWSRILCVPVQIFLGHWEYPEKIRMIGNPNQSI